MERRTYTVSETAEILGVSTDVVYRMKNDGILPAVKNLSAIRVNCRIGSLETNPARHRPVYKVNCRIGSLENCRPVSLEHVPVNCRIGSLETSAGVKERSFLVN